MLDFESVMYAKSDYEVRKENFLSSFDNESKLLKHFNLIFKKEKMFCEIFRPKKSLFGVGTNNIIERSFKTVKENFLERNKCFNAIHLIEKITASYERSIYTKLIDFLNNRSKYVYSGLSDIDNNVLRQIANNIVNYELIQVMEFYSPPDIDFELDLNFLDNSNNNENLISSPAIPDLTQNQCPDNFQDEQVLNKDLEKKGIEILKNLGDLPQYSKVLNKFYERLTKAKSVNSQINVIATGGVSNRNILRVQSRIKKNSNKNRFKDLRQKLFGNKPHNLSKAVSNNHINMQTQSKK